jgi:fumarylacetoacetase
MLNETHDGKRQSWVESANAPDTDFPIQNLPLGVFSHGDEGRGLGIAIGDQILDVGAAVKYKLLNSPRLAHLRHATKRVRLSPPDGNPLSHGGSKTVSAGGCPELHGFFRWHLSRPRGWLTPDNPLPQNYKYVPIAYHGRASSVRLSGEIRHPKGQLFNGTAPQYGLSQRLDLELEMGFFIGPGNELGEPVPIGAAESQIIGMCLLNDWSARDVQRWEMTPLGPFLSKSFSTMISPWVVTLDALAPFRIPAFPRPEGDPAPLDYLTDAGDQQSGGFDIHLSVLLRTGRMTEAGEQPVEIITSNAKHLYWTLAQMVTHHSSNGCNLLPGDLIGTGTISGPTRAELSSLLELTFGGKEPVTLPSGETRGFLADGDEITLAARCEREGFRSLGFGKVTGKIIP